MDRDYPIYTLRTECQDCYKCVRQCPVKAIKVEDGHASVVPELCVACGHCVQICPAKAKRVRDDLGRVKYLLERKEKVYVSLAPSWVSEFQGVDEKKIITALKKLGFAGVGETALGAQDVSAETASVLAKAGKGVFISSACPSCVEFIRKYMPEHAALSVTGMFSPLLAHCKILRKAFGNNIGIVFIGPCIAKKSEADMYPELLDVALTFSDMRRWLEEKKTDPAKIKPENSASFVPRASEEGGIYPVEGGMIDTIRAHELPPEVKYVAISGLHNIDKALSGIGLDGFDNPVFIEALACEGGCINGPCTSYEMPGLLARMKIVNKIKMPKKVLKRKASSNINMEIYPDPIIAPLQDETKIKDALRSVGKTSPDDELNCGGCGYETCRNFAKALLEKKAEPAMCLSYLRKQVQKKANALLRCIPAGVVIVDAEMKIIECNEFFAKMFDEATACAYEARPGLAGALISRIVPFHELFAGVLSGGKDMHRDSIKVGGRLYGITIFNIEPHQAVGAVIFDVTRTEMRREQIAEKAKKVIHKNLETVQEIACRLGEHMADTEILLRSIADDYTDNNEE